MYNDPSSINPRETSTMEMAQKSPKAGNENAGVLVIIQEYDPENHRLKVKRVDNNQPLRQSRWATEDISQKAPRTHRTAKTLKASPTKEGPIVEANIDEAKIQGNSKNGFYSTKGYGNIIKGPLSIEAEPHLIRLSGITILNPLITSGFPSTIATPLPATVFNPPGMAMLGEMSKQIAVMGALIGIGGIG